MVALNLLLFSVLTSVKCAHSIDDIMLNMKIIVLNVKKTCLCSRALCRLCLNLYKGVDGQWTHKLQGPNPTIKFWELFGCIRFKLWLARSKASCCLVAKSCLTLCNPWTIALQAPLSMAIFQARVLEWVVISFSRGSSWPRNWPMSPAQEASPALQVDSFITEPSEQYASLSNP